MSTQENKNIFQRFFKAPQSTRKLGAVCTGLVLLTLLLALLAIPFVHPVHAIHAISNNTAEDNFQRSDTTVGWGATTNSDGLTNLTWKRSLNGSKFAYTQSQNGVIVFAGTDGHKIAGFVAVPAQRGGDVLAKINFTVVGHAVGGVMLQANSLGTSWYQADMNTANKILEIRKRLNGIMTTVASIPFIYVANTAYWLRLDVQVNGATEQVNTRAWAANTIEPSNWQVTYTDNSLLPVGYAGAMGDWFNGPSPTEQVCFSSWSYAANGLATPAQ